MWFTLCPCPADRLTQQAVAQQQAVDQLQGSVRMLEGKIAEAKGKKETLKVSRLQ
jgi:phage shock protein A